MTKVNLETVVSYICKIPSIFVLQNSTLSVVQGAITHPQIYVFVLPLIGIAYDIVPVATKTRQRNHDLVLILSGLFGVIGFGAYAQPFFDTPGTPVREEALYVVTAVLAVPFSLLLLAFYYCKNALKTCTIQMM